MSRLLTASKPPKRFDTFSKISSAITIDPDGLQFTIS
jgi:hypothetical protein